ncbi:cytidylate kinase-like family protein [Prolixibacteraceae bacterium Z1-6]|uniref:Cytidylate kinase-like family protein n=1 Tax=Draconibacterium aestuarii TaxID=2998507 RepID=A0A9X3F7X8_9BACT|nr:cytidylate kinase-like family protein [Prolixibacteraceae bacterium Z1-6]
MGNSLMNYLNKRLNEENSNKKGSSDLAGPVITISREVGCNGLKLANLLASRLNKQKMVTQWKVMSKEIFHESARELDLEPEIIRKTFKKTDRYTFEQILKAFGDKRYKSEEKIIKTVREVVRILAVDGFNIIVGRASHIIAKDIKNALHIRLIAPIDYRINTIVHNNNLNKAEALKFIEKVEKERIAFRKVLKEDDLREELFDLTLNRASFTDEQAIEIIEHVVETKQLLANSKRKMEYY